MAAVTVNSRTDSVFGNKRSINANVSIAADADTWATGLAIIESVHASSPTNNAIGATISGGTVTFQTGGAEALAYVQVIGL